MRSLVFLVAALLLASCSSDATGPRPAELGGTWHRSEAQPAGAAQLRTEEWLELAGDGRYTWTTEVYGPEGRAADGLVETFSSGGDWRIRGDRLALRTRFGMGWRVGTGGYQADYILQWNQRQQVRLEGDLLHVTYLPRPEDSSVRGTVVFARVRPGRTLAAR